MSAKVLFISALAALFLASAQAQEVLGFLIVEAIGSNITTALPVCMGVPITSRHILTTADCNKSPTTSAHRLAIAEINRSGEISNIVDIVETFVHPDYNPSKPFENNIAIFMRAGSFDEKVVPPMTLGGIPSTNATCTLYGTVAVENANFTFYEPKSCDLSAPQMFCAYHESCALPAVSFVVKGSPVLCSEKSIDGFIISTQPATLSLTSPCVSDLASNRYYTRYISVGNCTDWIKKTSGAETVTKASILLLFVSLLQILCQ